MARFWLDRFFAWRDRDGDLHLVPSPWPEFCRWCWAKHGTGRTEPDQNAPPTKRSPITFIGTKRGYLRVVLPLSWGAFNRLCYELYGAGRTEPDE